ncbi:hypothetical protein O6072_22960 [Mycolicibacterium neoaurum]|uniref:hypothetical protein n=1 Tax=Mycolicibacterium neoaurum TaxID=1795 RepID=UPI00248B880C|nr:hypothetical protein [Mycolicibacterium neoaurum]WBP93861.1 hypothetical protein O7W24_22455 [Mycolicibacterium neoaurum]WBS07654.1 hypothetical protein O6072_22960 [Mycolicibacterium neoaurum]
MADDDIKTQIAEAQQAAKLAILRRIEKQASSTNSSSSVQSLGYAYALVVGAAPGYLPGGPTDINVSK